jgi:hypothetical protein
VKKPKRKKPAPKKKAAKRTPKRAAKPAAPQAQHTKKKRAKKRAAAASTTPQKPPRPRRPPKIRDRKSAFLAAYAVCASIAQAAKAAGVARRAHYDWQRQDPDYPARFEQAYQESNHALEDSAVERAMIGVYEPNVFQGKFVYPEREVVIPAKDGYPERVELRPIPGARPLGVYKRSEMLHALLLRGRMRERYGNFGTVEVSGLGGGAIPLADANLARLTDDEFATLKRIAQKLADPAGDSDGRETPVTQ